MYVNGILKTERAFIFEYYFTSKLFAAVRESFSNAHPLKKVQNKTTVRLLVTICGITGSVCLWQVLRTTKVIAVPISSKPAAATTAHGCKNSGFVALYVEGFMYISYGCVLSGTLCTCTILLKGICTRGSHPLRLEPYWAGETKQDCSARQNVFTGSYFFVSHWRKEEGSLKARCPLFAPYVGELQSSLF
jgi:hypothetical protein